MLSLQKVLARAEASTAAADRPSPAKGGDKTVMAPALVARLQAWELAEQLSCLGRNGRNGVKHRADATLRNARSGLALARSATEASYVERKRECPAYLCIYVRLRWSRILQGRWSCRIMLLVGRAGEPSDECLRPPRASGCT